MSKEDSKTYNKMISDKDKIKKELLYMYLDSFFLFLGVYYLIVRILMAIFWYYINKNLGANNFYDIFVNLFVGCCFKVLLLIPVLFVIKLFRNKIKTNQKEIGLWMYDIFFFVIIFCGGIVPFISISITQSYVVADLFIIFTTSLCLFLFGVFTEKKYLKIISYIFFILPAITLIISGMIQVYPQSTDKYISVSFIALFLNIKSIFDFLFPSIAFLVISSCIKKIKQEKRED